MQWFVACCMHFGKVVFQVWSTHRSHSGGVLLASGFSVKLIPLPFSFRSSWPGQQGDPNLPRARRTLMKTTKADACPADVPLTLNTPTWISKTFSTCLFKARQFGFCSNSRPLAVQLCGSRVYGWHCLLFMFLVPNKRHLLSYILCFLYSSVFNIFSGFCNKHI